VDSYEAQPVTADLVDAESFGPGPAIFRIEAPESWPGKAGQLRYAVEQLPEVLSAWPAFPECDYVAVYDFDARPEPQVLTAAAVAARTGAPILQQPGLTVPRPAVDATTPSLFSLLEAQQHTRFGLRLELASLLVDRAYDRLAPFWRGMLRSSIHTVGNGLFLSMRQLPLLGGIPRTVDDLALGWRAASVGLPCAPVRSVVWYDAYYSLRQAAQSRRFICTGYLDAQADIGSVPGAMRALLPVQLIRIHLRTMQWTVGPYLRLTAFGFAAVALPVWTLAALAAGYLLQVVDVLIAQRMWRGAASRPPASPGRMALAVVLAPVALLWLGTGARQAVVDRLLGIRRSVGKTER
jgi:hypothetical protein